MSDRTGWSKLALLRERAFGCRLTWVLTFNTQHRTVVGQLHKEPHSCQIELRRPRPNTEGDSEAKGLILQATRPPLPLPCWPLITNRYPKGIDCPRAPPPAGLFVSPGCPGPPPPPSSSCPLATEAQATVNTVQQFGRVARGLGRWVKRPANL
ncbi:hypothetical protein EN45_048410 [Penicillium chrysogenum]|uniref:Uncharacterized protein n=1 Tax=Penicillium chrysogenum TaxID=5076 RepID=A0A167RQS5_PENCH|nr:hypothetical protein N7534_007712 [Penicillium rubens]KZN86319.1 hypothetical protein EN45_048410 [Penicillium chrysogenum]